VGRGLCAIRNSKIKEIITKGLNNKEELKWVRSKDTWHRDNKKMKENIL